MSGGFKSFHPLTGFFFYIGALTLCMITTHPVYTATLLCLMIVLIALHQELDALKSLLKLYVPISLIYVVINPLFSHRGSHILFYIGDQPMTMESIVYGMFSSLTLLAILVIFVSYNAVITSNKFLYLFGSYLPKTGLLVVMTMRFVPLLKYRLSAITAVQQTKGIDVRHGRLLKRITDGMKLLQILLTLCLEEALQTADAMKAKGYGTGPRS